MLRYRREKNQGLDHQPGYIIDDEGYTVDLAVNPDFNHIEADAPQIDINQRYALYYPEKRPFFLEGMEIFQFPSDGLNVIYTRRIIDPVGGAKLTGKVGRFTYGLLSALDTSPTESLWDVSNGVEGREDNALFNIFRIKTDIVPALYAQLMYFSKYVGARAWWKAIHI